MGASRSKCIVCGRVFHDGQGIAVKVSDTLLYFHNKRCAIRFFKAFVEELDPNEAKRVASKVREAFDAALRKKAEAVGKKI